MARSRSGTVITLPDGRFQAVITLDDGARKRLPPFPKGTSKAMAQEKARAWSERAKELGVTSTYREKVAKAKEAQPGSFLSSSFVRSGCGPIPPQRASSSPSSGPEKPLRGAISP